MCLMCEFYYDWCEEPQCTEKVRGTDEYFTGRSGQVTYLHKGYSEPCEHIKARHDPECSVVKRQQQSYNYDGKQYIYFGYDSCDC